MYVVSNNNHPFPQELVEASVNKNILTYLKNQQNNVFLTPYVRVTRFVIVSKNDVF